MAEIHSSGGSAGEMLRNLMAARARHTDRRRILVACALAVLACGASASRNMPMLLVWNVSASAPKGLYLVLSGGTVARGATVASHLPDSIRAFAAKRGYLPQGIPLIKDVAAVAGDRACAFGNAIEVNGRAAARWRPFDARGRAMPHWQGCRRLKAGELLLLSHHPWSFDGRYFGVTRKRDLIGRAHLLWHG